MEYQKVASRPQPATTALSACGIDHVVWHVNDLARSRAFYVDFLGCQEWLEFTDGHVFLRCGECQIGLFAVHTPHIAQAYTEVDHVCLRFRDSHAQILRVLDHHGIPRLNRPEGLGRTPDLQRGIYIADPDGHVIQLMGRDRRQD